MYFLLMGRVVLQKLPDKYIKQFSIS